MVRSATHERQQRAGRRNDDARGAAGKRVQRRTQPCLLWLPQRDEGAPTTLDVQRRRAAEDDIRALPKHRLIFFADRLMQFTSHILE